MIICYGSPGKGIQHHREGQTLNQSWSMRKRKGRMQVFFLRDRAFIAQVKFTSCQSEISKQTGALLPTERRLWWETSGSGMFPCLGICGIRDRITLKKRINVMDLAVFSFKLKYQHTTYFTGFSCWEYQNKKNNISTSPELRKYGMSLFDEIQISSHLLLLFYSTKQN